MTTGEQPETHETPSYHAHIEEACKALSAGAIDEARRIIREKYPFTQPNNERQGCSDWQKVQVFIRDGFVDRYSGDRMVFPPVLRLLSTVMPDDFPFHPNWKTSECHFAYWHLLPTIDHVVPVSRGGIHEQSNWVTTSQLRNNAKSNWLLEELGWELKEPGRCEDWDGLLSWFMDYADRNQAILGNAYISSWYRAARQARRRGE